MIRLALILACAAGIAAAEAPSISRIIPGAITPGKPSKITLRGDNLDQVSDLWTSFEATVEKVSATPNEAVFNIQTLSGPPIGLGLVRLIGSNGISAPKYLMLDALPTVKGAKTNSTAASAMRLSLPVALEGTLEGMTSAFFRFNAKRGQSMIFDVVAQRSGSAMDPVLRLLDADGREILFCEDSVGADKDCHVRHKFEKAGEYLLELRDTQYGGGSKFHYRLRAGALEKESFPLTFLAKAELTRFHKTLPGIQERRSKDASFQMLAAPCSVHGKLEKANERDEYEFAVKKGQHLVFNGKSRSIGSPCDLYLRLQTATGKLIAESLLSGAEDASITNLFKEAGTYQLIVEEATRTGSAHFFYEVEMLPFQRGFGLSLEQDTYQATPGEEFELKVMPNRQGNFDGPIRLSVEGAGSSLVLLTNTVTTKTNAAVIKIQLSKEANPAQMLLFKLKGSARVDGEEFSTMAATKPAFRKHFPHLLWPPPELDGWIAVGVRSKPD
ncbi:MAG TPA: hypothetical protein VMZ27_05980 [Candidatus Saccharimonadales bacterium]|nr:hypothetical protein [Candidatus Saccharimonadales bacterium]